MNIGIIGAGNLGVGLAKHLRLAGHSIVLSFSRDENKLNQAANSLGARAGSPAEAAAFGDVTILTTVWGVTADALKQAGSPGGRKILWDCTNPLKPDMSGLTIGTTTSAGEEVARLAPWASVVKAIPPFAEVLHSASTLVGGARPGVFVCGDDTDARGTVARLVREIGAEPCDAGPLTMARYIEPAGMLLVQLAYMQGLGPRIGLTLAREIAAAA